MPAIITLTTHIAAPVERCFNLSLSIDLHKNSFKKTGEKAIAGVTGGLIGAGETVTWEAQHFGLKWKMKTRISKYQSPFYFVSEMEEGPFKKIYHQHIFKENGIHTIMTDIFEFEVPYGIFGKLIEKMVMTRHMRKLLETRNQLLRQIAQTDEWRKYLTSSKLHTESVKQIRL